MRSRLKKWMEHKNLISSELADNIGVNRATISHILSGRNNPSIDILQRLLNTYPDLNSNWLITGIGYMSIKSANEQEKRSRELSKIVVFYDDNSFEELNS